MNTQHFLDAVRLWLVDHGVSVGVTVALTLVALKVAAVLNRKIFARIFKGKEDEDSNKLQHSLTTAVHWLVTIAILAVGVSFLLGEVGVNMARVVDQAVDWLVGNGLKIVIIIALTFAALKASAVLAGRMVTILSRGKEDHESKKRADTLSSVIRWVLRTAILLVATVMLLGQVGVQIGPIIAAAGVVGLAVGFGAQNLVQDVISGFFLLLEDQVRVGDVVLLGDKGGLVEKITLRMVILRDFNGSVHYVRNGKIDVVTNMTKEYSYYVFDIGIAYREDVDAVIRVIEALGKELQSDPDFKDDIVAPLEVVGLDKFGDSAVVIKARFKTKPIKQWRIGREFNRRLKKKFDELNIEIPFPHITVYPGKDKKGDSPTLKIEMQGGAS
jgi:moderate conductance mechanosensitive channel